MMMGRESRRLSVISPASGTKAQLGALLGCETEVTHRGGGPSAFDAVQPAGRAGAVTPSKFSVQGPDGGVGVGVAPGGVGVGVAPGGVGDGVPPGGVGDGVAPGVGDGAGVPPGVGVGDGAGTPLPGLS